MSERLHMVDMWDYYICYKIRWHIPVPYVPVRVTRGALVDHRYTYASPRCRSSQYRILFHSQYLSGTILDAHVFGGVGLAGFKSRANLFHYLGS